MMATWGDPRSCRLTEGTREAPSERDPPQPPGLSMFSLYATK